MRHELDKVHRPVNKAITVARAMAYLAINEDCSGQTIFVADNECVKLEGPLRALQPQWLGKKNAAILQPTEATSLLVAT
jgi:hypothetical protein